MKKVQVNYRIDEDVAQMLNTIAIEENRSLNNAVETLIREYYKNTRKYGEMENFKKEELIKIAMDDYNKMADALGWELSKEEDFKVIDEKLNIEFRERAYHINDGQYCARSGVESKHWIKYKDGTQYLIKKTSFNDIFSDNKKNKKDEIIRIEYLV